MCSCAGGDIGHRGINEAQTISGRFTLPCSCIITPIFWLSALADTFIKLFMFLKYVLVVTFSFSGNYLNGSITNVLLVFTGKSGPNKNALNIPNGSSNYNFQNGTVSQLFRISKKIIYLLLFQTLVFSPTYDCYKFMVSLKN